MQSPSKSSTVPIPAFPNFKPLSAIGRKTYEKHVRDYDPYSDYGYTSLHAWSRDHEHLISELNGNIILSMFGYMNGEKILSFLGNEDINLTALKLLKYIKSHEGYADGLFLVPEITANAITDSGLKVEEDRDNHDYILSTRQFIDMTGSGFAHTRRKISLFKRAYEGHYKTYPISLAEENIQQAILSLANKWAFMGTEGSVSSHEEIAAINRLLNDIQVLNINGEIHATGLFIDDILQGFCIYELHGQYATVHFIKANLDFAGAADFVMVTTMKKIYVDHNVSFVNHEQDLGILGLRAAKKRYCPTGFLKKYTVTQKN